MKNSIHPILKERYSPFGFDEKPITVTQIEKFVEAASWAPSAFNDQPWRFAYVIKGDKAFDQVLSTFVDYNKQWASSASALIVVMRRNDFEHNGKPNNYACYDTGAASMSLIIQAMSEGIYAHQLAGFDHLALQNLLTLDDSVSIIACMALGYPKDIEAIPSLFIERAKAVRTRKLVSEIAYRIELS